jgi:capping protein beta
MEKIKLNSCLQLAKKLPVKSLETNTVGLSNLLIKSETATEFIQKVDKPLTICKEDSLGDFIKSEYNNEMDCYRSPWSNKYFPEAKLPKYPPNELRELESILNRMFKEYTKLYYGGQAVVSVYVWEQGESIESGFQSAVLIKNVVNNIKGLRDGEWDSTNLINVKFYKEKERNVERIKATYKISSSVIFNLAMNKVDVQLTGTITKQVK